MRPISLCVASLTCTVFLALPTQAQIQAESNSTDTHVSKSGNQFDISGGQLSKDGANVFHSFEKFGLSQQQVANFLSNPATRNILGRVMGGDPSVINGLIKVTGSNANLYLMNPAGMIFGPNAALDVPAAFTATTANGIGFGSNWFSGSGPNDYANLVGTPTAFAFTTQEPGAITNTGNLSVNPDQNLTLMGGIVINQGELKAPGGQVNAVAVPGQNLVRLSQENHLLSLEFKPLSTVETLPNDWTLPITSLPNLLTGGDIQNATNLNTNSKGQLVLSGSNVSVDPVAGTVIAAGKLDAANLLENQSGGSVLVLGDRVGVVDAVVDASGDSDGGNVLIGGDFQGKGSIPTAKRTFVSENSVIHADALTKGDGGEVIVWADKVTSFYGNVNARGGNQAGDGGFVEVSGKQDLIFRGSVNTNAQQGNGGILLLDPTNITIKDGIGDGDDDGLGSFKGDDNRLGQVLDNGDDNAPTTIFQSELENLDGDTDVILQATNNITIENLLGDELTFQSGSGSIFFTADSDNDGIGSLEVYNSKMIKAVGNSASDNDGIGKIVTNGRNLTIRGASIIAGAIDTSAPLAGGNVSLTSTTGDVIVRYISTVGRSGAEEPRGGNITINSSGLFQATGVFKPKDTTTVATNFGDVTEAEATVLSLDTSTNGASTSQEEFKGGLINITHSGNDFVVGARSLFGEVEGDRRLKLIKPFSFPEGASGTRGAVISRQTNGNGVAAYLDDGLSGNQPSTISITSLPHAPDSTPGPPPESDSTPDSRPESDSTPDSRPESDSTSDSRPESDPTPDSLLDSDSLSDSKQNAEKDSCHAFEKDDRLDLNEVKPSECKKQ